MRASPIARPIERRHRSAVRAAAAIVAAAAPAVVAAAAGCADPSSGIVIVQNQKAKPAMEGTACEVLAEATDPQIAGRFDVNLDRPYPYFVYPLVENQLPSVTTLGGIERNSVTLRAVRVSIVAPAGVTPGWQTGCPASFDAPASAVLAPGGLQALDVPGFRECHAVRLRELIAARAIPADSTQPVYFRLELRVVADRAGSEILSPVFPFDVQVCAGCLQALFPDTPTCATAPKPNPYHGNACNIAQDGGPVLCCVDTGGKLVCPAPDM